MQLQYIFMWFFFHALHTCQGELMTRYEFENAVGGAGQKRTPWRSEASGQSALHVYHGDKIVLYMCLGEPMEVTVEHMIYSNDGHSDVIEININENLNTSLFKYTKPTTGGWGHHWNSFFATQRIGKVVNLPQGRHSLSFLVYAADCYGVELDQVTIRTDTDIRSSSFWCGAEFLESKLPFFPICGRTALPDLFYFTTRLNMAGITPKPRRLTVLTEGAVNSDQGTSTTSSSRVFITTDKTTKLGWRDDGIKNSGGDIVNNGGGIENSGGDLGSNGDKVHLAGDIVNSTGDKVNNSGDKVNSDGGKVNSDGDTVNSDGSKVNRIGEKVSSGEGKVNNGGDKVNNGGGNVNSVGDKVNNDGDKINSVGDKANSGGGKVNSGGGNVNSGGDIVNSRKFIEQLSYHSMCLDDKNVHIRFNPTSLTGVQIKVKSGNNKVKHTFENGEHISENATCRKTFWQIGKIDNRNTEFGELRQGDVINYDFDAKEALPGTINPQKNRKLTIQYTISADKDIKRGVAYFTLGLVDVVTNIKVGLQYEKNSDNGHSSIQYATFTPELTVIGWDLPLQSIAVDVENKIHLFFDNSSSQLVKIDFIRLDHTDHTTKFSYSPLANIPSWIIEGFEYMSIPGQSTPNGMNVLIDGTLQGRNFAKVVIKKKPVFKVLTITKDGLLMPHHETRGVRKQSMDYGGDKFSDASGIRFSDFDKEFATIDINTKSSFVTLTFKDDSFVRLTFEYSYVRTKLVIVDGSLEIPRISFLSTKISENIAAVNTVFINERREFDVLDQSLNYIYDTAYDFKKLTPNLMYATSGEILIQFPKKNIPH